MPPDVRQISDLRGPPQGLRPGRATAAQRVQVSGTDGRSDARLTFVIRAAARSAPSSGVSAPTPERVEDLDLITAEEPVEPQRGEMPEGQDDEDAVSVTHPHVRPFVPWTSTASGEVAVLDALPSPSAAQRVRSVFVGAIVAEGPISRARLVRLVAESFGLSRVSGARATDILRLIPDAHVRQGEEQFVWPVDVDVVTWRDGRTSAPGRVDRSSPSLWKRSRTRWPLSLSSAVGCARMRSNEKLCGCSVESG